MKTERTEEQVCGLIPLSVQFGAETYEIPLLRMNAQRKWRELLQKELGEIVEVMRGKDVDSRVILRSLAASMIDFPVKISDLVFAYAPALPRKKIEEEATEEQMARAFSAIMTVAYPFGSQLEQLIQVVRA